MIPEAAKTVGVELGVGQNGAPFAGGDLFVGIEAEDGEIAEGADAALMDFGADGFAGVFEDYEILSVGEVA